MTSPIILGLVNNAALLMALVLAYDMLVHIPQKVRGRLQQIYTGLILGLIGIAVMLNPWNFGQGVVFDTRSVIIGITGFFFGTIPAVLAVFITSAFRLVSGGAGAWTGVSVIATSGAIGLMWRHFRRNLPYAPSLGEIYIFGLVIHIAMLGCMFTLPVPMALEVLSRISLPVMLIYPLTTAVLGMLLIHRETHAQSETALRESEEKHRATALYLNKIFDALPIGLWFADKNGKLLRGNPAGVNIWGAEPTVSMEEYGVFKARRLPSGQEIDPDDWALAHTIRDGITVENELLEIDAFDGQAKRILNYTTPVKDDSGQVLGAIVMNVDVTDRARAEQSLIDSERKWRNILVNTPQIGISLDPRGTIVFANAHFLNLTGWTEPEILGRDWFDFFIPEPIREQIREVFHAVMSNRETLGFTSYENDIVTKTGEIRNIAWSNVLTKDPRGEVLDVTCLGIDLTERNRAEEDRARLQAQLHQAQKMESVGRLAGGVAHDFNNMLGVILGHTELVLDKIPPDHPIHDNLKEINTAALRSADLTRQLLAFARKQIIAPKEIDLNDTIEGMLKMLRRLIGEDIDLVWRPGPGLWPVKMDSSQLDQVLANLCVNARDAIAGVGKITIETGNIHSEGVCLDDHTGFTPGDYVLLAVSDNGHGMDQQTLDNIFEPFFTTKGVGEGTGLGLSTVYGIVKQNSGTIEVSSEPGKGTAFRIYLPRQEGTLSGSVMEEKTKAPRGEGETVLIVEDETAVLELAKKMLTGLGYRVLGAPTPRQALEIAKDHPGRIDLVMTDVVMPEMNGRDLANLLQGSHPDINILFMSGYTANVIAHRGILDEGVCFIQKPFSYRELAAGVHHALRKT